jgi:tocopherol cyclase
VLVILCGINRHPDGDWATVAIAAHPGGFVRSAVVPHASAHTDRFHVVAGDGVFEADEHGVRVDLGDDARAELLLHHRVTWPRLVGAGGLFATLPWLGQYWHPHVR